MMFSVPAGNALIFSGPDGALLDTPLTQSTSRDVASTPAASTTAV